jgi:hypothetical protein
MIRGLTPKSVTIKPPIFRWRSSLHSLSAWVFSTSEDSNFSGARDSVERFLKKLSLSSSMRLVCEPPFSRSSGFAQQTQDFLSTR